MKSNLDEQHTPVKFAPHCNVSEIKKITWSK